MQLFLSYHFPDDHWVRRVGYYLKKQGGLHPYFFSDEVHTRGFVAEIGEAIERADAFVLFVGSELGQVQGKEAQAAIVRREVLERQGNSSLQLLRVSLPGATILPGSLTIFAATCPEFRVQSLDEAGAESCAREIVKCLGRAWSGVDDLPIGYPFDYEKTIIAEYSNDELDGKWIALGCPSEWPRVQRKSATVENLVSDAEIGLFRDWDYEKKERREEDPQILTAALTQIDTDRLIRRRLTLPEAGPRKFLHYPTSAIGSLQVGILVSGGIAPGINSVIAGIVERQHLYAARGGYEPLLEVRGYHNGLKALLRTGTQYSRLTPEKVASQANLGGSLLGTSRAKEFMETDPTQVERSLRKAVDRLVSAGVEIVYIIGGDGSMRAAHALRHKAREMREDISIVGIPKTMDNDILWVWQSFGFLSAVQWSTEAIQNLHTEAKSNPRLCVIQLFGSDSGFVVTHAVTASGVCDLFLVPEVPFTLKEVSEYICERLTKRYKESEGRERTYGMIVMAETAIPLDAEDYMDDSAVGLVDEEKRAIRSFLKEGRRVFGQTPDELRSGGLKLVSRTMEKRIQCLRGDYWKDFRVFANEPRHLIRSIPPSSGDIIFGHRLGSLAVDCAMAGYDDFMISQWLTEYVMVPLRLVTLGRKRIPKEGVFYKSARASTGQPADLARIQPTGDAGSDEGAQARGPAGI